jgi:hypothetical protein
MRMRLKWIPKEDEELDQPVGNPGANLLIATEWTALQLHDWSCEFRGVRRASVSRMRSSLFRMDKGRSVHGGLERALPVLWRLGRMDLST